ncbi:MAG: DNA primase [Lachnospiraceae bacterium]|nr:DNA primase [Lachnospiraceae bacterium]
MYYPEETIEEIRSRSDIVSVISGFISLQKKGSNYVCCCPFHNEKTPSFSVNPSRQIYKCFGCGEGGNVFTFLQKYENMTFPEAVEYLAPKAGVTLPERDNSYESRQKAGKKLRLYDLNKDAANYFYMNLHDERRGKTGMQYLKNRKLTDETIQNFALGYAPVNTKEIISYLRNKGYSDEEIRDSGIASFSERDGLTCKFWNRVIFPILDDKKKVIGFGGRVMGDGEPKYLNSPESEIFNKRKNLYGFCFARSSRKNRFILCEGYMDVISLHQAGFTEAVASLGTAFTWEQARILSRFSPDVYICYDSDAAGTKAAMRAIEIMRQVGVTGRVINMKPYKDPDEFIKNLGAEEFEKRMENAEDSLLFQVHTTEKNYNTAEYAEKTRFHHEIAAFLAQMEDPLERDNYLDAVAREYNIDKAHLKEAVAKEAMILADKPVREEGSQPAGNGGKDKSDKLSQSEKMMLTYLINEPALYPQIKSYITEDDFSEGIYREVARLILKELEDGEVPNPARIISMYEDPEDQSMVSSLFTTEVRQLETKEDKEKAVAEILYKLKERNFRRHEETRGNDISAITESIAEKKALQEIKKMQIRL